MRDKSFPELPAGQTMFEIISVLAVISLVTIGLIRGLNISLKNVRFTREKSLSENYATQAAEWLIAQRDENWEDLVDYAAVNEGRIHCLNSLSPLTCTSDCPCNAGEVIAGTAYQRQLTLISIGSPVNELQAEIEVTWASARTGGENFSLTLNLTNWK